MLRVLLKINLRSIVCKDSAVGGFSCFVKIGEEVDSGQKCVKIPTSNFLHYLFGFCYLNHFFLFQGRQNPFLDLIRTIDIAGKQRRFFDVASFGQKYGNSRFFGFSKIYSVLRRFGYFARDNY